MRLQPRWLVLPLALSAACAGRGGRDPQRPAAPTPVDAESPRSESPIPRVVVGARPAYRWPKDESISESDLNALWDRQLMVPVEGMARGAIRDDFQAKRVENGGGDRIHAALDLMAPRFTPVLAADDCVIGRLFTGPIGGIVIYASDLQQRFVYYYAHLQRYRRGLAVGDTVAKGSVIGYVGTTGNAPPDAPHLHFQVMKRGVGRAWWDGPAINPLLFFTFDGVRL